MLCLALMLGALCAFSESTVRIGIVSDISSIDPHVALDTISSAVLYNVFENLVSFKDDSLDIVPSLAASWKHSEDWKTWTYDLRKDVKFHDGTPLTADVVVASFKDVPNFVATIRKTGEMSVEFTLPSGDAHFNDFLAQPYYAISLPSLKATGKPYGTGPYIFKSWEKGKRLTIEANPSWWKGRVKVDQMIFIVYPNQDALINGLIAREIDLAEWLTSDAVLKLRQYPFLYIETKLGSNTAFLSMNILKAPLSNIRVREAIAHAINVVDMARKFFPGASGAPATTAIPPTLFKTMVKPTPYDPGLAKRMIEQSGVDVSKPIRLLESWAPRPYMPDPHGIAMEIKKYLEDVGLKVTVQSDPDNYFPRIRGGDIDMALNGWIADNGDPVEFLAANFHTDSIGHNNVSRFSNKEFDQIVSRARVQEGYELKISLTKALEIFRRESPSVPLFWGAQSAVWNTRIKGYSVHPSSQMFLWNISVENGAGK